jgi:hypothetical protein
MIEQLVVTYNTALFMLPKVIFLAVLIAVIHLLASRAAFFGCITASGTICHSDSASGVVDVEIRSALLISSVKVE